MPGFIMHVQLACLQVTALLLYMSDMFYHHYGSENCCCFEHNGFLQTNLLQGSRFRKVIIFGLATHIPLMDDFFETLGWNI